MIYTLPAFLTVDNKDTSNNKYSYEKLCIECIQENIDELKKQERELLKLVKEQGNFGLIKLSPFDYFKWGF